MVKKIIICAILITAAAAAVYFVFFRTNEEMKIRRLLTDFCQDAAKNKENSSPAALLLKTNVLKNYFTDPCNLSVHHGILYGSYTDVRAANEIMRANLFVENSTLSFSDLQIIVNSNEASANFTGRFQAKLKGSDRVDEVREIELKLRKIDGKWKISNAEIHKILEK